MNLETTEPGLANKRNLVLLALFAAVGVMISVGTYAVSGGFERIGVVPMIAVIVLIAPVTVLVVTGMSQGLQYFADLRAAWTWWHWLLLLLTFSTLVFRVRDNSQVNANPVDAWALLRIGPDFIVVVILWLRLRNRETNWRHSLFQGLLGILSIYGGVCIVSSIWSVFPAWTLYKSLEVMLDFATVAAILATMTSELELRQMFNWIWMLYGLDLVWAWIGAAIWPTESLDELGRLQCVWPVISYNSLGASSAMVSVVALARLLAPKQGKNDRAWYTLLLAFGLITLMASQTRNSMAGFVVGAALVLFYERRTWLGALGVACTIPLLLFTSMGPRMVQFLSRDQTESQIEGMSSRVDWWTFAWHQFQQRPFTGYGAYAAGKFAVLGKLGIEASQIHSDWMEVLTGSSFWGLIPFVAAAVGCWWIIGRSYGDRSLNRDERTWLPEIAGVFGVITVRSFFNVELSWHAPLLYLAVIAFAEHLRRKRKLAVAVLSKSPSLI
jgi:O-antigen ligase